MAAFKKILASQNILNEKLFILTKFYVNSSAMKMVRHMWSISIVTSIFLLHNEYQILQINITRHLMGFR